MPKDEKRPPLVEPTPSPLTDLRWPLIAKQDYDNLPHQPEGLHAAGFEYMRLSHEVEA